MEPGSRSIAPTTAKSAGSRRRIEVDEFPRRLKFEGSPGSSNECGFNILRKWDACDNPKPRVYVMSSYLVNSTREAVAKLRVSDILDKPFSPAGFRQRIEGELKRA